MATSTRAGTMDAYKPRRPGTTYEDSMTSEDIKKMTAQKEEASTQRKTEAAQEAAKKDMGMKKGGMTAKGWGKARGARGAKVY